MLLAALVAIVASSAANVGQLPGVGAFTSTPTVGVQTTVSVGVQSTVSSQTTIVSALAITESTRQQTNAAPVRGRLPASIWNQLTFNLTMRLLDNFTESLTVKYSSDYKEKEEQVLNMLQESFSHCPAYLQSSVTNFRNGSIIVSFSIQFDPERLIFSPTVYVNEITDCVLTSSLALLKNQTTVDDSHIDNITAEEVRRQNVTLSAYVSRPCSIPRVCPSACYRCHDDDARSPYCLYNSSCSQMATNWDCVVGDNGEAYCGCRSDYQVFMGKCQPYLHVISFILSIAAGCVLGVGLIIGISCCFYLTYGKTPGTTTVNPYQQANLASTAAKTSGVSNPALNLYPEVKSQKATEPQSSAAQATYKSGINDGVSLRVSTLPAAGQAYKRVTPPETSFRGEISDEMPCTHL